MVLARGLLWPLPLLAGAGQGASKRILLLIIQETIKLHLRGRLGPQETPIAEPKSAVPVARIPDPNAWRREGRWNRIAVIVRDVREELVEVRDLGRRGPDPHEVCAKLPPRDGRIHKAILERHLWPDVVPDRVSENRIIDSAVVGDATVFLGWLCAAGGVPVRCCSLRRCPSPVAGGKGKRGSLLGAAAATGRSLRSLLTVFV
jgi:hypothetical protein